jgi:hypothetical protein
MDAGDRATDVAVAENLSKSLISLILGYEDSMGIRIISIARFRRDGTNLKTDRVIKL